MKSLKPTITAFKTSPDKGTGLAHDMRIRWALEEVDQPYDVRLTTLDFVYPLAPAIEDGSSTHGVVICGSGDGSR